MRRQDKHIINGILLGAGIIVLADVLIQWWQLEQAETIHMGKL